MLFGVDEASAIDIGAAASQRWAGLVPSHAPENVFVGVGLLLVALEEDGRVRDVASAAAVEGHGFDDASVVRLQGTRNVVWVRLRLFAVAYARVVADVVPNRRRLVGGGRVWQLGGAMPRAHEDEALSRLRYAEVLGVQQTSVRAEAVLSQDGLELAVDVEADGIVQARHILHDDEVRGGLGNDRSEPQQEGLPVVVAFASIKRRERLAGGTCGIYGRICWPYADFAAERVDVDIDDVLLDEAAWLVVALVGVLQALVVVDTSDYVDAGIEKPSGQAARAAEEIDGLYHRVAVRPPRTLAAPNTVFGACTPRAVNCNSLNSESICSTVWYIWCGGSPSELVPSATIIRRVSHVHG